MKKIFTVVLSLAFLISPELGEALARADGPALQAPFSVCNDQALGLKSRWFAAGLSLSPSVFRRIKDTFRLYLESPSKQKLAKSIFSTPGALGIWAYAGLRNTVIIGWLEGLLFMAGLYFDINFWRPLEMHAGHRDTETVFQHSLLLIFREYLPTIGWIFLGLFLAHLAFGVLMPYKRYPVRSVGHAVRATLSLSLSMVGLLLMVPGSIGNGVYFDVLTALGLFLGVFIQGSIATAIIFFTPHPWGPRMQPSFDFTQFWRSPSATDSLIVEVLSKFVIASVKSIDWTPGGYKGLPFPVVTIPSGHSFAVKRLKVEGLPSAVFVSEFAQYLHSHRVPLVILHRRGTTGNRAEDYFVQVFNELTTRTEYYIVEHFVEQATRVPRRRASALHLRAVGRLLGRIHDLSEKFNKKFIVDRIYSFNKALTAVTDPFSDWRMTLIPHLSNEDMILIGHEVQVANHYWTSYRLESPNLHRLPIISDLNFSGLKFDQKTREIVALFDWDDTRVAYRIEDFFATLVQGEPPFYFKNIRRDLQYLLEGYAESVENPLSSHEMMALPEMFIVQTLWKIAVRAKNLTGNWRHDRKWLSEIHQAVAGLKRIRRDFTDWDGRFQPVVHSDIRISRPKRLEKGLSVQSIRMQGRRVMAEGEAFVVDLHHLVPVQRYADAIRERDVYSEPLDRQDPNTGRTLDQYIREEMQGDYPGGAHEVVLGFPSTQGQLWDPNTLLVVDGKWVVRNPTRRGFRQTQLIVKLQGSFSVLSLDPEHPGIFDLVIENGQTAPSLPVKNGFAGPLLLRNGKNVLSKLKFNRRPPLSGNALGWRSEDQPSPMTAFGYDQSGCLVVLQLGGEAHTGYRQDPTLPQMVEVLQKLGVQDAILGGSSGDVQRYSKHSQPVMKWFLAREGSRLQKHLEEPHGQRRLGTTVLFYRRHQPRFSRERLIGYFRRSS